MEFSASTFNIPASSSSTTSSSASRNKVALKPGRSLMDWIRLTNSGKDLTSTGGKVLAVSVQELSKHNTVNDAWIALRGKVYNITHYLEYHPGGEDELMRGAGKDATDLFNQVHQWVNAESMLQKCFIGVLKKSWTMDVPKFPNLEKLKFFPKKPISANSANLCVNENSSMQEKESVELLHIKSKWSILSSSSDLNDVSIRFDEHEDLLKLQISNSCVKHQGLITDLVEKELYVKINNSNSSFLNITLSAAYEEHYKVAIKDGLAVELFLKKQTGSPSIECPSTRLEYRLCHPKDKLVYWSCKLISKTPINHNTYLFTFLLPPGTKMWTPIGHHVQIRSDIEGAEVVRSYTPICSSLNPNLNDKLEGSKITLMIKIYASGILTPVISRCNLGESIHISSYCGNFTESFVENCDSIVMLAAGTGITPMIRIIYWVITDKYVKRSLQLLFFNKTEEDILWRKELEDCKLTYNEFQIDHILSEPSLKWTGYTGQVNSDILAQLITVKSALINQRLLICGPLSFIQTSLNCLTEAGFNEEDIHVFTGS